MNDWRIGEADDALLGFRAKVFAFAVPPGANGDTSIHADLVQETLNMLLHSRLATAELLADLSIFAGGAD